MAKLNVSASDPSNRPTTHEGAFAVRINPTLQLKRSVMSCLLWESQFYEEGESIAERIVKTIPLVDPQKVADIAIEAREKMKLRHVPLFIVREMARLKTHQHLVAKTLERVIQRADELTEFLAIYWKDGRQKLSAQVKKGLAATFPKFSAYNLSKYDRDGIVKLRDVLFLCHAKPKDDTQAEVWKKLIDGKLESPDTWEVALSAGKDKKETWERLISENKLAGLAYLRNLRNMQESNVPKTTIKEGLIKTDTSKVLPFRFIAAARFAPDLEPELETKMFEVISEMEKLSGETVILVDVSGSMNDRLSSKSDMTRMDAACGVAMVGRELCQSTTVFTFSSKLAQVPSRRGFALRDAIVSSQSHQATYLGQAIKLIEEKFNYDRMIIITDEQSHDQVSNPKAKSYIINVASYQNGVGYHNNFIHVDGWSEAVINYICEYEKLEGGN